MSNAYQCFQRNFLATYAIQLCLLKYFMKQQRQLQDHSATTVLLLRFLNDYYTRSLIHQTSNSSEEIR